MNIASTGKRTSPPVAKKAPPPISRKTPARTSYSSSPRPTTPRPTTAPVPYSRPSPTPPPTSTAPVPYAPPSMPLPPHLAKLRPPVLVGEVTDTREIQVKAADNPIEKIIRYTFAIIMLPFRPFVVLAALIFGGKRPTEKDTVYTVRIQRADGRTQPARIERDIRGTTIELGDYVSIWGNDDGGVIIVSMAFNHSVGAEVKLK